MAKQTAGSTYCPALVAIAGRIEDATDGRKWSLELKHPVVLVFDEEPGKGFCIPAGTVIHFPLGVMQQQVATALAATAPAGELLLAIAQAEDKLELPAYLQQDIPF